MPHGRQTTRIQAASRSTLSGEQRYKKTDAETNKNDVSKFAYTDATYFLLKEQEKAGSKCEPGCKFVRTAS